MQPPEECGTCDTARRSLLLSSVLLLTAPATSNAAVDCFTDCFKNCKLIAPKDPEYCQSSCKEYCDQPDRTDGLSGSISSEGGETGILGRSTAVKGEDKLPQVKLPGLDFVNDGGRKLLGY
ncbi:hypothetical protein THAOC_27172 [Thalassiosira oceanica]|uniref:Uncharacterized protein n=1 Tax=Thalassiosira oceanica TaxID=159749 RepID=K0S3B8_THAOC|nr:hypothetical protein THAOC_27172 [Thalassiosira oceanica]|eukprot:EJK53402.1 hypothetical protein THAOC_27172 [Thalassiosira oceanica]